MRSIGQIQSENQAKLFSDFLVAQRIPNQVESGSNGHWDIWVLSDDDLPKATQHLAEFRANPGAAQYTKASAEANKIRAQEEEAREQFQKRVRGRDNLFQRFITFSVGPLTAILMALSIGVFIWAHLDENFRIIGLREGVRKLQWMFFGQGYFPYDISARIKGSLEIRSGEYWRLITPIFLHFGIMHIVFNMMCLRTLGAMIETVKGSFFFAVMVLVSGAFSNWSQYVVTGSFNFGGMSGVIYALLGYVWMMGKYHPGSGLNLPKQVVQFMIIWLVIGFSKILESFMVMANWAHLSGLVVGVIWGYLESRRR